MNLNLGCGPTKKEGYVNVDINTSYNPDLSFDLNKPWPIESNSVDNILMDNVIEHLDAGIQDWLFEAKRSLKPNGILTIRCPNCFHWKARIRYLLGEFKANSGYHYDHRWLFKPSFLKEWIESYGFETNKVNDLFDQEIHITARKRL